MDFVLLPKDDFKQRKCNQSNTATTNSHTHRVLEIKILGSDKSD